MHVADPLVRAEHLEHRGRDAIEDDGGDAQREDPPTDPPHAAAANGSALLRPRVPANLLRGVNVDGRLVRVLTLR
jgi:hypothetical protein